MAPRRGNVVFAVEKLAAPVAEQLGLSLWDIEFVKEGSSYFLRIFIDRAEGVSIEDCEAMSRAIDKELDRVDPIDQSYCLEVSSPGIERLLTKDWHFERFLGKKVKTRLIRPDAAGRREIEGVLESYDNGVAQIAADGETVLVKKAEAAFFKLCDDAFFDNATD